ncbi:LLM class flavin-dependent oxidoreductase [Streptomyces sp. NPDC018610]|uniref:LLM class flavin-dependent oxidoreductase n=1 Tax=Streptomyces sp. NPDC018610 TaxID=3365049 RepID=UPI0037978653
MTSSHGRALLHLAADIGGRRSYDAGPYAEAARLAESGRLDFVTLEDGFARPGPDALTVLSRAAPATRRVGLVPTVTTTHTEPFQVQAAVATLDRVSRGRAGWRIEVSATEGEARLFGRRPFPGLPAPTGQGGPAPSVEELWRRAAETVETAERLWDGGDDGRADGAGNPTAEAVERPGDGRKDGREGGREGGAGNRGAATAGRAHHAGPTGGALSVRCPSAVPRPPQGRPVRVVDATEGHARSVAARYADVVLVRAASPAQAATLRDQLRAAAAGFGRDPGTLRVLASLVVDLGDGEYAAERGHGGGGPRPSERGPLYRGGPVDLAELIAAWHRAGAVDGFHLVPAEPFRDLERLVNGTVALLQHRGLFRTFYPGGTLREHLGLGRPASRYARTGGAA